MLTERNEDDRRHYKRIINKEAVRLQFKEPGHFEGCLSCDISEGGVQITMKDFIPLYAELVLYIKLAKAKFVECLGQVVWVNKQRYGEYYQAGIEFVPAGNTFDSKEVIRQYVDATTP